MSTETMLLITMLGIYFAPTLLAMNRELSNTVSILVLNLFLGWTLIGWVIALALACSGTATKWKARS
jgi:hypothetical protein